MDRSRTLPTVAAGFVAAGLTSLLGCLVLLLGTLSPMWATGSETATLPLEQQPQSKPHSDLALSPSSDLGLRHPRLAAPPPVRIVNGVAFSITVPVLAYRADVHQGVDAKTLELGPGHYPGTVSPGQVGTVGVAAHNVYWLGFARLKRGDEVDLRTVRGLFRYTITTIRVTSPTDRTVLVPADDNRLALTTCYPLWAGAYATQRLIFLGRQTAYVPAPA